LKSSTPYEGATVIIPLNIRGSFEQLVCSATAQRSDAELYWYLDGAFLASTLVNHSLSVDISAGSHRLVVQNEEGASASVRFTVFKAAKGK
jgi:penicillin-binding protein 1C